MVVEASVRGKVVPLVTAWDRVKRQEGARDKIIPSEGLSLQLGPTSSVPSTSPQSTQI